MDENKKILGNENAIAAFNRIKQKHGFRSVGELVIQGAKANDNLQKIDVEKVQQIMNNAPTDPDLVAKEIINADKIFDIMHFIDEQNLPNNVKAALGILLSGERSEIRNAIKRLEKELE